MTFKRLYKDLQKELSIINSKTFKTHCEKDIAHQKTKLQYEKFQLMKQKKCTKAIDEKIAGLTSSGIKAPRINNAIAKEIIFEKQVNKVNMMNMANITTFLRSQREYSELVERYNPGLGMEQDDRVKRTANRVGLELPEEY